ncbi:STAS domain-containing protein [Vibrio sp. SCSIO 43132]|uniref:STAS domain-containing protein n=1 Tax=Vibrio sp. SCSIO 43132 TaxID=2779363 RepID=UPI001CA96D4B|nr:STAS domain-containing protein [Vibrio sp. SCSIO 43132]UAB71988.1 STAS domain-containing protein [Vibrio sp. SCSIO 43132]
MESAITINSLDSTLIASIQVDLTNNVLLGFQQQLLEQIHKRSVDGVLLDLSGVGTLDRTNFEHLRKIIDSVGIMGTTCVLVGLRPGLVCALVELNVNTDGLQTVTSLEQGIELINQRRTGGA